jgi:hypothetical protein
MAVKASMTMTVHHAHNGSVDFIMQITMVAREWMHLGYEYHSNAIISTSLMHIES